MAAPLSRGSHFFIQISPESVLPGLRSDSAVGVVVIGVNFTLDIETIVKEVHCAGDRLITVHLVAVVSDFRAANEDDILTRFECDGVIVISFSTNG